jgi:hypothetical protein
MQSMPLRFAPATFIAFVLAVFVLASFAPRAVAGPPLDPAPAPRPATPSDPAENNPPPLLDATLDAHANSSSSPGPTSAPAALSASSDARPLPSAVAHEWEERIGLIGGVTGATLAIGTVLALYVGTTSGADIPQDAKIGMGIGAGILSLYAAYLGAAGGVIAGSAVGAVVDAAARPPP